MGRLFWKFFFFIWLAQLAGILGTGALFWFDRQRLEARIEAGLSPEFRPPPGFEPPPRSADGHRPTTPGHGPRPPPLPLQHIVVGLLASLLCAAGLAWYVARPIRQLRGAFNAAAEGGLDVQIGARMGRRRDELADLGVDFDHMMGRLRALMDGQQRLLHDVSHELRSPLARLQAAIGLARQQPARLDDSLLRIEREAERMNRLVGELLTLSRLEAGVNAALESVDLTELLSGLIEDARFEAAARDVAVDCLNLPDLRVRANGELLHRAIENVLRNALRFSPAGGRVQIEVLPLAGLRCRIAIADQGPGVPAEETALIFTPFFRGVAPGDGYGLGLAIARRVLLSVNGEIRAENLPDGGLQVVLEMPVESPA
jgi:two-component system, OmpR family, sensor kinase